jgi:transcriptional antiterminator RfaH
MNIWRDTNWFAIYTKPKREAAATMNIQSLGLEVLFPLVKTTKKLWGVPHEVAKPLFPNYLFARFSPNTYLHLIQFTRGVRQVVRGGALPLPVDEEIIQLIKEEISENGFINLKQKRLQPGDPVIITEGPLQGLKGLFNQELKDKERVVILLEAIKYQANILIEKRHVHYAAEVI